ncbi:MAG: hypothetical protein ABSH30_12080 [Acidimicrobiales bacterium]|jgi:hypothetical protein
MSDEPSAGEARSGNLVTRSMAAFGRFWWDFLVGDTPELFVATLIVIALAEGLHRSHVLAVVIVPVAAIGFLGWSTWRGRKPLK